MEEDSGIQYNWWEVPEEIDEIDQMDQNEQLNYPETKSELATTLTVNWKPNNDKTETTFAENLEKLVLTYLTVFVESGVFPGVLAAVLDDFLILINKCLITEIPLKEIEAVLFKAFGCPDRRTTSAAKKNQSDTYQSFVSNTGDKTDNAGKIGHQNVLTPVNLDLNSHAQENVPYEEQPAALETAMLFPTGHKEAVAPSADDKENAAASLQNGRASSGWDTIKGRRKTSRTKRYCSRSPETNWLTVLSSKKLGNRHKGLC